MGKIVNACACWLIQQMLANNTKYGSHTITWFPADALIRTEVKTLHVFIACLCLSHITTAMSFNLYAILNDLGTLHLPLQNSLWNNKNCNDWWCSQSLQGICDTGKSHWKLRLHLPLAKQKAGTFIVLCYVRQCSMCVT